MGRRCLMLGCPKTASRNQPFCIGHWWEYLLYCGGIGGKDLYSEDAIRTFVDSAGPLSTLDAAKFLGIRPRRLLAWLRNGRITSLPRRLGNPHALIYFKPSEIVRAKRSLEMVSLKEAAAILGLPLNKVDHLVCDLKFPHELSISGKGFVLERERLPELSEWHRKLRETEWLRRVAARREKNNGLLTSYQLAKITGYSAEHIKSLAKADLLPHKMRDGCFLFRANQPLVKAFRALSLKILQPAYRPKARMASQKLTAWIKQQRVQQLPGQ